MKVTRAITCLKLSSANDGKLEKLDELASVYIPILSQYVSVLSQHRELLNKNLPDAELNKFGIGEILTVRWRRVCWQQACALVLSWVRAGRKGNAPTITKTSITCSANVAWIQEPYNGTPGVDYWIKFSGLRPKEVSWLPVKLYDNAKKLLKQGKLATSSKFEKISGKWYVTLYVNKEVEKIGIDKVRGADPGYACYLTDSNGNRFGEFDSELSVRIKADKEHRERIKKQNACLRKKGLPIVELSMNRNSRWVRHRANATANKFISSLERFEAVALENLNVAQVIKGTQWNQGQWRQSCQLGYFMQSIKNKLEWLGIPCKLTNPAYSSQRCPKCGCVDSTNRRNQEQFVCVSCGFATHADHVGALNHKERFFDAELNSCTVSKARELLKKRYELSQGVCRTSSRLDGACLDPLSLVNANS